VDRFLARVQADLSRSRIQTLIQDGHVRVNGVVVRPSHRVRAGDRVEVEPPAPPASVGLEPEDRPLAVVYEDEHVVVIDKPAGLVVHPGAGVRTGTLAHALLHHAPGVRDVGGEGRPGLVHRLDKDTSGLLVVAKTQRAHRVLVEAMKHREVRRTYLALVWGDPRQDSGAIEGAVGRDPRDRRRMAVVARGGRPARTRWEVVERFGPAALLRVHLDTGRTHQIRVHLRHARLPVVGDPVYGGRGKNLLSQGEGERSLARALLACLGRQALHACELGFRHPVTGEERSFASAPPEDFARALEALRAFARGSRRHPSRGARSDTEHGDV
jgi:23S rRNA pseudouridine1911/1915/1917 synthase